MVSSVQDGRSTAGGHPATLDDAREPGRQRPVSRGLGRMLDRRVTPAGVLAGALVVSVLAGCGSSAPNRPAELSSHAAAALRQEVADVRSGVAAHNPARARSALDAFSHLTDQDAAAGELSSAEVSALRTDAAQARSELTTQLASATAPTTPAATSPPATTKPAKTTKPATATKPAKTTKPATPTKPATADAPGVTTTQEVTPTPTVSPPAAVTTPPTATTPPAVTTTTPPVTTPAVTTTAPTPVTPQPQGSS
jgi:hypothetical protein